MDLTKIDRAAALRLLEQRGVREMQFRFGTVVQRSVLGELEVRGGLSADGGTDAEARQSQDGTLTMRGHAAVFDRLSLDLGYFRERVAPGAFDGVLAANPHATANWNHDDNLAFSSTRGNRGNGSLELSIDALGLRWFAYPAYDPETKAFPTYVEDLRILMRAGVVAQSSFKFTVGADEWYIDSADNITRTILEVDGLYDVCACAIAAYPQTDSEASRALLEDEATRAASAAQLVADEQTATALGEAAAARQRTLEDAERRRRLAHATTTTTRRKVA